MICAQKRSHLVKNTPKDDCWFFKEETVRNSPSVRDGMDHARELSYRQQCASYIQDIGQRLDTTQIVINTAIVYMHRFYMVRSFQKFHRNVMGRLKSLFALPNTFYKPHTTVYITKKN